MYNEEIGPGSLIQMTIELTLLNHPTNNPTEPWMNY